MNGKSAVTPPRSFMSPRIRSRSGPARGATQMGIATIAPLRGAGAAAGAVWPEREAGSR